MDRSKMDKKRKNYAAIYNVIDYRCAIILLICVHRCRHIIACSFKAIIMSFSQIC